MRKTIYLSLLVCFSIAIIFEETAAQVLKNDSSSQEIAMSIAKDNLYRTLGNQSGLYNGPEYYFYDPLIKNTAYFMDVNAFNTGSVNYDGIIYNNVPMLYDLYSDKIVVLLYNKFSKYSLLNEKVQGFDFLNHRFVNLLPDSLTGSVNINPGFYQELYSGRLQLLVKLVKTIQTTTGSAAATERYFVLVKDYYLKKDMTYYKVNNESSFLNVLNDKKNLIKDYMKINQIKFRKDPEGAMIKIANYYDRLTN